MFNSSKDYSILSKKVWLSSPTMHGDELKYVQQAYDTNWMSTVGENIIEIEKSVAQIIESNYAVALSTGTSSLHLAIRLAGEKVYGKTENGKGALKGHKVFCSDLTFSATVNPIVYESGDPVFIDSEYETWNMDPLALEKAFKLYPDVKIIVLVHLYGTPAKVDEIRKIAEEHDAIIVEDAAESLGAIYKGKPTGTLGDCGCISFNGNKIITGSSGGMFLTNSMDDAQQVRKWSTQSREKTSWYQHEEIGYNYRMSNVIAGVVRGQLPYLQEHIQQKKEIYNRYKVGLKDLPIKMNPVKPQMEKLVQEQNESGCEKATESNYWLSCMLIDKVAICKQIREELKSFYTPEIQKSCPTEILEVLNKINAEGRPVWKPMHLQPIYKENAFITKDSELEEIAHAQKENVNINLTNKNKLNILDEMMNVDNSVSADIFTRGVCLPSDIKITQEEQNKIIEIIGRCFE